jgi:hypothetical protein
MSRAQGHIANVLWVLFDHVIESQKQIHQERDSDMAMGKTTTVFLSSFTWYLCKTCISDALKIPWVFKVSNRTISVPYYKIWYKIRFVYKLINKPWFI